MDIYLILIINHYVLGNLLENELLVILLKEKVDLI